MNQGMTAAAVFDRDAAKITGQIAALGAVVVEPDGFAWVDEAKVPADLLSAYRGLIQYGYANGLL
jgi:hypothetical protein